MKTVKESIVDIKTGIETIIEHQIDEILIPQSEPIQEPTLEEKYEELQSLVAELLEVLNG
jgi:hypothetical protein